MENNVTEEDVQHNLSIINEKIDNMVKKLNLKKKPRLVAVSKTKPSSLIQSVYNTGHREFGENYVQEILEKAPILPLDIKWHFIGHLQSNKIKKLLEIKNLDVIETIDSLKLAKKLDDTLKEQKRKINIFLQVNTSGEDQKSGVEPEKCVDLYREIQTTCENITIKGLMTIGKLDGDASEDFKRLADVKKDVCSNLNIQSDDLELSMGMSSDFEVAIENGSTNVRVGSTIFVPRKYK
eukprot:TRINITY_DN3391_c0_g1_i1.p1 TRINITY_DN3391_c0_g1~~TRINITY_DN3391_c0_g1_i1.p1  ORF type:complete len:237 (-),score=65.15 TRINITY_DN3391_c0_g1_i1:70-780(-)